MGPGIAPSRPTRSPRRPAPTFASFRVNLSKIEAGGAATAYYDNLVFKPAGTCGTTPDRLCLNNDRFQVTSTFENYASVTGAGIGPVDDRPTPATSGSSARPTSRS